MIPVYFEPLQKNPYTLKKTRYLSLDFLNPDLTEKSLDLYVCVHTLPQTGFYTESYVQMHTT